MGNAIQSAIHTSAMTNSRTNPGIWLAMLIALGLHGLILLLPLSGQKTDTTPVSAQIELRLTKFEPPAVAREIFLTEPEPLPPSAPLPTPIVQDKPVPLVKAPAQVAASTPPAATIKPIERELRQMTPVEKTRLTHTILSSQFITDESAADQLFGPAIARYNTETRTEFHYPEKDNLVAMLDQPMQDLPFEYRPGLIHFAYAPGLKGDLQRFWDVITPEFGMITDHGTEIRCMWVLVIAACGWK